MTHWDQFSSSNSGGTDSIAFHAGSPWVIRLFFVIDAQHPRPAASQPGRLSVCAECAPPLFQFVVGNLCSAQLSGLRVNAQLRCRIAKNLEIKGNTLLEGKPFARYSMLHRGICCRIVLWC